MHIRLGEVGVAKIHSLEIGSSKPKFEKISFAEIRGDGGVLHPPFVPSQDPLLEYFEVRLDRHKRLPVPSWKRINN
jgi:hypothetical protein